MGASFVHLLTNYRGSGEVVTFARFHINPRSRQLKRLGRTRIRGRSRCNNFNLLMAFRFRWVLCNPIRLSFRCVTFEAIFFSCEASSRTTNAAIPWLRFVLLLKKKEKIRFFYFSKKSLLQLSSASLTRNASRSPLREGLFHRLRGTRELWWGENLEVIHFSW